MLEQFAATLLVDLWRRHPLTRQEWEARERAGLCPECGQRTCPRTCRKSFFDAAYSAGFHDGANNLHRHGHAFVVAMMDFGAYDDGGESDALG
ncbi:MAG TPA: hypothetical protein VJ777_28705 [Mycobacterium sp.]|nr:hypothetical protein [Mycobacterium sp.]